MSEKISGGDEKMNTFLLMGGKEGEMRLRTAKLLSEGNWLEI